jgi:hypothetical protein
MNYPTAIVISAGLIAGALLSSGPGISQVPGSAGRFAFTNVPGVPGLTGGWVWRGDTTSGMVSICQGVNSSVEPECSPWAPTVPPRPLVVPPAR